MAHKKIHHKIISEHKAEHNSEHKPHHEQHPEKININFMLILVVGIVALVAIFAMILGTNTINTSLNSQDTSGLAYGTIVSTSEVNVVLNSASVTASGSGNIVAGNSFTGRVNIAGGTPPYTLISAKCDGIAKSAAISGSSVQQSCAFTTAGIHTLVIVGQDSSTRTATVSNCTQTTALTAEVIGDCTRIISAPKQFTVTFNVRVNAPQTAPTATLSASSTSIAPGELVTFTASFTGGTSPYHDVTFYCGDGTTGKISPLSAETSANSITATCSYAAAGTYTAYATGYDSSKSAVDENVAVTAQVIGIGNKQATSNKIAIRVSSISSAPTATLSASSTSIAPGELVTFTASFTGGTSPYHDVTFYCGDGTTGKISPLSAETSANSVTATCSYAAAGTYNAYAIGYDSSKITNENVAATAEVIGVGNKQITSNKIVILVNAPQATQPLTATFGTIPSSTYVDTKIDFITTVSGGLLPYELVQYTCGNEICPQYVAPAPNWCSDGTIVPSKSDINGCSMPPTCVRTGINPRNEVTADAVSSGVITPPPTLPVIISTPYPKSCIYTQSGTYTLTFTIKDSNNNVKSITKTISISPKPAVLTASLSSALEYAPIAYTLTLNGGALPYQNVNLDCGDGTALIPMHNIIDSNGATNKFSASCTYTKAGVYTATATAEDSGIGTVDPAVRTLDMIGKRKYFSASYNVRIDPRATITTSSSTVFLDSLTSFTLTVVGGRLPYHDAVIDCGNGDISSMSAVTGSSSNNQFKGTCTYKAKGKYTITAKVYDSSRFVVPVDDKQTSASSGQGPRDQLFTATSTITVVYQDAILTSSSNPVSTNQKVEYRLTLANGVRPYKNIKLSCGEGMTAIAMVPVSDVKDQFSASCTYVSEGKYNVKATAEDSSSGALIGIITADKRLRAKTYSVSLPVQVLDYELILSSQAIYTKTEQNTRYRLNAGKIAPSSVKLYCGDNSVTNMILTASPFGLYMYEGYCKYKQKGTYEAVAQAEYKIDAATGVISSSETAVSSTINTKKSNPINMLVVDPIDAKLSIRSVNSNETTETIFFWLKIKGGLKDYKISLDCGNEKPEVPMRYLPIDPYVEQPMIDLYTGGYDIYAATCEYSVFGSAKSYNSVASGVDSLDEEFSADMTGIIINSSLVCTSTDGNDPNVFGTTYGRIQGGGSYVTLSDSCSGTSLIEYSCGANGFIQTETVRCAYGCGGGICSASSGSGGSGGGSGGGGGGGGSRCYPSWSCTDWSSCVNAEQIRTCTDAHACGTTSGKPVETLSCSVESSATSVQSQTGNGNTQTGTLEQDNQAASGQNTQSFIDFIKAKSALWAILVLAVVVAIVLGIYFTVVKPRQDELASGTERKLEDWASAEETQGYTKAQLREFLLGKGYPAKDVEEAVKRARPKAKAK